MVPKWSKRANPGAPREGSWSQPLPGLHFGSHFWCFLLDFWWFFDDILADFFFIFIKILEKCKYSVKKRQPKCNQRVLSANLHSCKIHGGGGVAASGRIQLNEFSNRSKARRFSPFGACRDSRSAGFNQILTRSLSFTTFVKLCLSVSQLFSKLLLDHAIRSFSAFITSSSPRDFWPYRTVLDKIRRSYLYSRLPRQLVEN